MLDEPSLGLAPRLVTEVFALIRRIRDEDVTMLLVEQNIAKALAVADDAHVLERGRLLASGRASDLLRSNLVQSAYLGARSARDDRRLALPALEGWRRRVLSCTVCALSDVNHP
jgi:ABC-type lipopolysaccharide export system ATPase subunit